MHSEPILWIIGVDEKAGIVGLTDSQDPGQWYAVVRSVFDGMAPDLGGIVCFEFDGKDLVAIQLETDSAPYVVKNIFGDGTVQFEVPWRDGTLLRSAHQRELLQILLPLRRLPNFETLEATLIAEPTGTGGSAEWRLDLVAFVEPATEDLVTVPFHRMQVAIKRNDAVASEVSLTLSVQMRPVADYGLLDHRRIWATNAEVMIGCPGRVRVSARGYDIFAATPVEPDSERRVVVRVLPVGADIRRVFDVTLVPASDRGSNVGRWVFPPDRSDEPHDRNAARINLPPPLTPPSFLPPV